MRQQSLCHFGTFVSLLYLTQLYWMTLAALASATRGRAAIRVLRPRLGFNPVFGREDCKRTDFCGTLEGRRLLVMVQSRRNQVRQ